MQTDVFLQKTLVEEVKEVLKGYTSLNNGVFCDFNVYPQNLPAKKGKNDEDHFPYVLVCLDEEQINGETDPNICSIYFLVGIKDENQNKQGHFDVANVLNLIADDLLQKRLINNEFRLTFPLTKKFQEEDTWPKFIGGMSTLWTVNTIQVKETEYD
ncbi:MAG: hypothetical protein PHT84_00280 [Candidatus Pacebacteria bacterium]|nr:hypothetical protein [Candidatus Paceibacterota bacterium]